MYILYYNIWYVLFNIYYYMCTLEYGSRSIVAGVPQRWWACTQSEGLALAGRPEGPSGPDLTGALGVQFHWINHIQLYNCHIYGYMAIIILCYNAHISNCFIAIVRSMGEPTRTAPRIVMSSLRVVSFMWVKQCHKPPMTGNGKHTTLKNGDDWGMVYGIAFFHIIWDCDPWCFFYKVDTAPRDGLVFEADLALEHHQLYTLKNHVFLGGEGGKVLLLG